MLRFGAWYEHRWIDVDVEAPEFLVSRDVLRGRSCEALVEIAAEVDSLNISQKPLGVRSQEGTVGVGCVKEKYFGGKTGLWKARLIEELNPLP